MERKPEAAAQTQEHETKKPYHKPEVIVYGNIREVTRNLVRKVMMMEVAAPQPDQRPEPDLCHALPVLDLWSWSYLQ